MINHYIKTRIKLEEVEDHAEISETDQVELDGFDVFFEFKTCGEEISK